jgi:replicative DNA helicase
MPILPSNADAERSLLGAILLRPSFLAACRSANVKPEGFSVGSHAEIYRTLIRMADEGKPIDTLLLREEIDVKQVGGEAYVSDLTRDVILVESHVLARCRIIKRNAELRRIIKIADEMQTAARKQGAVPQQIIVEAIPKLSDVSQVVG